MAVQGHLRYVLLVAEGFGNSIYYSEDIVSWLYSAYSVGGKPRNQLNRP